MNALVFNLLNSHKVLIMNNMDQNFIISQHMNNVM